VYRQDAYEGRNVARMRAWILAQAGESEPRPDGCRRRLVHEPHLARLHPARAFLHGAPLDGVVASRTPITRRGLRRPRPPVALRTKWASIFSTTSKSALRPSSFGR
jgi:hypothetical protein